MWKKKNLTVEVRELLKTKESFSKALWKWFQVGYKEMLLKNEQLLENIERNIPKLIDGVKIFSERFLFQPFHQKKPFEIQTDFKQILLTFDYTTNKISLVKLLNATL